MVSVWSQARANAVDTDGFVRVCDTHRHLEVFSVRMALQRKADNMLESFHEGTVANAPLMLGAIRVNVGNENGKSSIGFNL